jgi:hypothetical protein
MLVSLVRSRVDQQLNATQAYFISLFDVRCHNRLPSFFKYRCLLVSSAYFQS